MEQNPAFIAKVYWVTKGQSAISLYRNYCLHKSVVDRRTYKTTRIANYESFSSYWYTFSFTNLQTVENVFFKSTYTEYFTLNTQFFLPKSTNSSICSLVRLMVYWNWCFKAQNLIRFLNSDLATCCGAHCAIVSIDFIVRLRWSIPIE